MPDDEPGAETAGEVDGACCARQLAVMTRAQPVTKTLLNKKTAFFGRIAGA